MHIKEIQAAIDKYQAVVVYPKNNQERAQIVKILEIFGWKFAHRKTLLERILAIFGIGSFFDEFPILLMSDKKYLPFAIGSEYANVTISGADFIKDNQSTADADIELRYMESRIWHCRNNHTCYEDKNDSSKWHCEKCNISYRKLPSE